MSQNVKHVQALTVLFVILFVAQPPLFSSQTQHHARVVPCNGGTQLRWQHKHQPHRH
jgi:hypothetical protein